MAGVPQKQCKNGHLYVEGSYKIYRGHKNCLICLRRNWADVREKHPDRGKKYYNKEKHRVQEAKRRKNNPEVYKRYEEKRRQTDKYLLKSYKNGATARNLTMSLSDEEILTLCKGNCYYCNKLNCRGIDRVDNFRGYEKDNSISCCVGCNKSKMARTQEEFYSMVKQIAVHRLGAKFDS